MVLLAGAHEPVEEAGLFIVGPVLCALCAAVDIVGIGVVLGGVAAALEGVGVGGVGGLALEDGGGGAGEGEGRVGGGRGRLGRRVGGGAEVAGAGVRLGGAGQVRTQRLAEAVLVEGGLGRRGSAARGTGTGSGTYGCGIDGLFSALLHRHVAVLHAGLAVSAFCESMRAMSCADN